MELAGQGAVTFVAAASRCAVNKHRPEPHILLFRRALGTDPVTGKVVPEQAELARQQYYREYGIESDPDRK